MIVEQCIKPGDTFVRRRYIISRDHPMSSGISGHLRFTLNIIDKCSYNHDPPL